MVMGRDISLVVDAGTSSPAAVEAVLFCLQDTMNRPVNVIAIR
tara:strand:- start:17663 stop:17791 length:129 start_codon:yes stop_codon:yes gene_type:complete